MSRQTIVAAVIAVLLVLGLAWYGTQSDLDDTRAQVEEILSEGG